LISLGSQQLGQKFLDSESNHDERLLADDDFVKNQIKSLDKHFEDQGLFDLKSEGKSEGNPRQELFVNKLYDMETMLNQAEERHREQLKINSELADKI
jgi:hypothetical protein